MKTYSTETNYAVAGTSVASPREPEFQVALKRLTEINARLSELSIVAWQSADKIVGPLPESASANPKLDTVPSGYLAEMMKTLDSTSSLVENIYRNMTRVTNEF